MSDTIEIELEGTDTLVARLNEANAKLLSLLRSRLTTWAMEIREQSAAAAGSKTGKLASSITAGVTSSPTSVTVNVRSTGVPYAAIQEFGGSIPGHDIYPVKGVALSFAFGMRGSLGNDFFARVFWPGATLRPKHYIMGTIQAHRQEFYEICRIAELESLREQ
jgi:hypothetical protein